MAVNARPFLRRGGHSLRLSQRNPEAGAIVDNAEVPAAQRPEHLRETLVAILKRHVIKFLIKVLGLIFKVKVNGVRMDDLGQDGVNHVQRVDGSRGPQVSLS